jgi:hypothetical protein
MPAEQPILLTPEEDGGYRLRGATKLGALLFAEGASVGSAKLASPQRFDPCASEQDLVLLWERRVAV